MRAGWRGADAAPDRERGPGEARTLLEAATGTSTAPAARDAARAGRGAGESDRPVIGYQRWDRILMVHWEVSPAALRPLVPEGIELDLFDGRAYLSATPFTMRRARVRGVPPLPLIREFHELNLRTYVRVGDAAGIWFLSLDAASTAAAAIARATLGLPYFRARMSRTAAGDAHEYESERLPPRGPPARFSARWRVGAVVPHPAGSLDDFLAERHALYSRLAGRRVRVRVRHPPWVLHEVSLDRLEQDVTAAAGIDVPERPLLARFSPGTDVEVLAPEVVDGRPQGRGGAGPR